MSSVQVVVPAYNPGQLLRRALDSVRSQTFTDWECLVLDDGGAEDLGWVDGYGDDRVSRVRQPNAGVSIARNVGVATSTAPLIAFLDQDDEWLPSKLGRQISALRDARNDPALCYTDFWWVTGDHEARSGDQTVTYEGLLADQHICLSSVLVSRDAYWRVGGHNPLLAQMQDWDLFLRLLMTGAPSARVAEPLVRYHLHQANASRDYLTARAERLELLSQHQRHAARQSKDAVVAACAKGRRRTDELFGAQAYDRARSSLRQGRTEGFRHLARAVRWSPSTVGRGAASFARPAGQRVTSPT